MKKLLVIMFVLALGLSLVAMGCGQEETDTTEKTPEVVKTAEQADSTAMDEVVVDSTLVDSIAAETDSM